ncbi:MAG TPA: hypothetical protein VGU01_14410 [Sphingomicrobium sp.]|nr:hypothetical protein [Sphingomicrobium sp.]
MGEPFRANSREDDTLADWFEQADKNHDGRLTIEEMQQDAERFFALLDVNHDGEIDPDEITRYENVVAPEVRTGEHYSMASLDGAGQESGERHQEDRGGGRGGGGHRHGNGGGGRTPGFFRGGDDPHQGAGRYGLLDLPEPVVSADADFNRGVSLSEFRQAAAQRFLALDLDHHGYLTLASLETIRPAPPAAPNAPSKPKESDDSVPPSY